MATNLYFNGSQDPLLGGTQQPTDYEQRMAELAQMQQSLEAQRKQIQTHQQPQQSKSPIWDEIEKITADFTDREFELVNRNEDFLASQEALMAIVQREQMRMIRPIVEGTKDGHEALEKHLTLIKRLKKDAAREADRNMELFSEYTQNYPDMTFSDFLKMKSGTGKKSSNKK